MNKRILRPRTALIGTLVLSVLAATARSLALITAFDTRVGYFDPNVFSTLLYIAIALFAVGLIAYTVLTVRTSKSTDTASVDLCDRYKTRPLALRVGLIPTVILWVGHTVFEAIILLRHEFSVLHLLAAVTALLGAIYFIQLPDKATPTAFAPLAWCLIVLITEYFDQTVAVNSPLKLFNQFALLAAVLYLTAELNALCGNAQIRRTLPLGMLATFLCLTDGISAIVAWFASNALPPVYTMHAGVIATLGIYIAARLAIVTAPHTPNQKEDL